MNKLTFAIAIGISVATHASQTSAQAQQRDFRNVNGAYVGGAIGLFGASASNTALKDAGSSINKNGTGGKLFAGYQITEYFGAEIGGIRSSTLKRGFAVNSVNVAQQGTANAFYAAGTARFPIGEQFSLNTKLGVARGKFSGTNVLPTASSITGGKTGAIFAVGAEYRFTPKIAATIDYDYLPKTSQRLRTAMWSLGMKVAF